MIELIDSHAHLDDEKFDNDREEIISKIKDAGIKNFITAGYSLGSSKKAVELAEKYDFIYATCGISPNDIPQDEEKMWKQISEIEKMMKKQKNKVVAIGEIGLDYYWEKDEKMRELQRKAFIKQIELANKLKLPIVIHTREAIMDTLEILKQNLVDKKGVFHCCPQNRELIKEGLKLGFYISFAGPITFKSSKNAEEMINLVPDNRILIETDSPYLAPEPVRGTRNDSSNVIYMAEKIAQVKQMSTTEVAKATYENAKRIFQIL